MSGYNLLLIMADQFRWDALGRTGGWARTPHLDALADEGMLFANCLTNSPVCIPARVSLATGLYPHNTGVWKNIEYDMPAETNTWMQAVRRAGYRTCLIGKTHLHRHRGDLREREPLMNAYGFDRVNEIGGPRACMWVGSHMTDEWARAGLLDAYIRDFRERFAQKPFAAKASVLPLELYADVYVGTQAREFILDYREERPWFCMASFGGPHEPWDAPEPYASLYEPELMPKAIPRPDDRAARPRGHLDELMREERHSPALSERDVAEMRANYAGNVTLIDEQIGSLVQALKERGMYEKTVIVFTSDHGEMNGDYGLIYKENLLNSAVKVPLVIRTPDLRERGLAGTVYGGMVELFDVGPTLCELAGGRLEHKQFARSLVPVLQRGADTPHREEAISEIHGELLLQNREWKMALNGEGEPYLLFHLAEDPQERRNRVRDPACREVVDSLRGKMLQRLMTGQFVLN